MSDLAEVFELAHRAREAFRTVRATVRTWRDEELTQEAFARFHEQTAREGSGTIYMFAQSDEEEPPETEEITRLWLERPSRWREEVEGRHPHTIVTDGERAWWWDSSMGAIEQPESEQLPESGAFLHPAHVLAGLELELLGRTTVHGREAVHVRARPRVKVASWADFVHFGALGVPPGADEYELALDAERGVLLRATASLDGRIFATTEVVEIAFDDEFPPETFVFVPPPGELVRRAEDAFAAPEHDLTLGEAAERVDFSLWIPARMTAGWELDVLYIPAHDRLPMPEQVVIHYWSEREGQLSLHERKVDEPLEPGRRWEEVERDGRRIFVWEPESRLPVPVQVLLEREGTRIELSSAELGRDRLLDLAAALVRAPIEPPPLFRDG